MSSLFKVALSSAYWWASIFFIRTYRPTANRLFFTSGIVKVYQCWLKLPPNILQWLNHPLEISNYYSFLFSFKMALNFIENKDHCIPSKTNTDSMLPSGKQEERTDKPKSWKFTCCVWYRKKGLDFVFPVVLVWNIQSLSHEHQKPWKSCMIRACWVVPRFLTIYTVNYSIQASIVWPESLDSWPGVKKSDTGTIITKAIFREIGADQWNSWFVFRVP